VFPPNIFFVQLAVFLVLMLSDALFRIKTMNPGLLAAVFHIHPANAFPHWWPIPSLTLLCSFCWSTSPKACLSLGKSLFKNLIDHWGIQIHFLPPFPP
jgi:hypothetical protein